MALRHRQRAGAPDPFASLASYEEEETKPEERIVKRQIVTDANGNRIEETFREVEDEERAELEKGMKVPKNYELVGHYHQTAEYARQRPLKMGKDTKYRRSNDINASTRMGAVYRKPKPIDMQGREMKNIKLGADTELTPAMQQGVQALFDKMMDAYKRNETLPEEVIEELEQVEKNRPRSFAVFMDRWEEGVEDHERKTSRSMSRDLADQISSDDTSDDDIILPAITTKEKQLVRSQLITNVLKAEALQNQPTLGTSIEAHIHIDDAKDNEVDKVAAAARNAGVDLEAYEPRFVDIQEFFMEPRVGAKARTNKRGATETGTVVQIGEEPIAGQPFAKKKYYIVKYSDDEEVKVYQNEVEFGWQSSDGPEPWNRNMRNFDAKFDSMFEHGGDPMQFYKGHKQVSDMDRINKIIKKDPVAGKKIMDSYIEVQNIPSNLVWNPKMKLAEMAVDFAFIDNGHMVLRQAHSDVTHAAAPSEVRQAALVAVSKQREAEDEAPDPKRRRRDMSMHGRRAQARLYRDAAIDDDEEMATRTVEPFIGPLPEGGLQIRPSSSKPKAMPDADAASSAKNGAIPTPATPIEQKKTKIVKSTG